MKKPKIVGVALVMAVMLMGSGYAYWQQKLTVSSTVSTGELNVVFERSSADDFANKPHAADYVDVGLTNSNYGHNLTFSLQKLYPGSGGWIDFKIKNTGSVPAKLSGIKAANVSDTAVQLGNKLEYRIDKVLYWHQILGNWEFVTMPWPQGALVANSVADLATQLQERLGDTVLEPGGFLEIVSTETGYNISMPAGITDLGLQGKDLSFDLALTYTQAQ